MGFFNRRKDSRAQNPDSEHGKPAYNSTGKHTYPADRISDYSLKSPSLSTSSSFRSNMVTSIPEIDIPQPPDRDAKPAQYLRSIYAVRERSRVVLDTAKADKLNHFDVDMSKFQDTADYVVAIIKRDFAPDYSTIPPHGRWQHFEVGGRPRITQLLQSWPSSIDSTERTRRLIDLFLVSVLLDAGAGTKWSYTSKENGKKYSRSEGLAVASLEMFKTGMFSNDASNPHQCDALALEKLTADQLGKGMQVSDSNPMSGLEGRAALLTRLGGALRSRSDMFGKNTRPGNMIDYLISHPDTVAAAVPVVPLPVLWEVLMDGLSSIWPATRTNINGVSLGDAWPCSTIPSRGSLKNIVPFHKLTQWLCYSIMVPMTKLMNMQFAGAELMTGLPEYRNGGLLVDTGLLTLKKADTDRGLRIYHETMPNASSEVVPMFEPSDDVVVEWRAVTVGFLDELLAAVNKGLGLTDSDKLSLAQMLEAGTWKGGREIAQVSRPITKGPPIGIISDGTIF